MKTYVHWSERRIDTKDMLHGLVLEKTLSFPDFLAAARFAKGLSNTTDLVGKPLVEEAA